MEGKKRRRKGGGGGGTDREVPVSDEKSGWRFSVLTLARSMETKQVRLRGKASIGTNALVDQKTRCWVEICLFQRSCKSNRRKYVKMVK